jgi:hypothetical protein
MSVVAPFLQLDISTLTANKQARFIRKQQWNEQSNLTNVYGCPWGCTIKLFTAVATLLQARVPAMPFIFTLV